MVACEFDGEGLFCLVHICGSYDQCLQENCPHCSFIKPKYDDSKMQEVSKTVLSQLSDGLFERDCA